MENKEIESRASYKRQEQAIFEKVLSDMGMSELCELQCKISKMMMRRFSDVSSEYEDLSSKD